MKEQPVVSVMVDATARCPEFRITENFHMACALDLIATQCNMWKGATTKIATEAVTVDKMLFCYD